MGNRLAFWGLRFLVCPVCSNGLVKFRDLLKNLDGFLTEDEGVVSALFALEDEAGAEKVDTESEGAPTLPHKLRSCGVPKQN